MDKVHYSEIENAGGIVAALNIAFKEINSELRAINDVDTKLFPIAYARIIKDNKFSQVYIAAEEKLYLPDYWRSGVCLAHGRINDIKLLVESIDYWLQTEENTEKLANKYYFVTPKHDAKIFDEENEVEYKWQSILNNPRKELKSFVEIAINNPILSKLFPYTSLWTLCFSRCTGYPFTNDTPTVSPIIKTGQYLVRDSNGNEIGVGTANDALEMVMNNLPKDIKPAVKGTADDL